MIDTHTPKTIHLRKEIVMAMDLVSDWGEKYKIADMGILMILLTDEIFSSRLKESSPELFDRLTEIWEGYQK